MDCTALAAQRPGSLVTLTTLPSELAHVVAEASAEELPRLIGMLSEATARAQAKLLTATSAASADGNGPGPAKEQDPALLTYQEAAHLLRCSASYVETLVRQGKLPHVRLPAADKAGRPRDGRLIRFRASDLRAWADEHRA